jgi:hypothetical protein
MFDDDEGSIPSLAGGTARGGDGRDIALPSRSLFASLVAPLQQTCATGPANEGDAADQGATADDLTALSRSLMATPRRSNSPAGEGVDHAPVAWHSPSPGAASTSDPLENAPTADATNRRVGDLSSTSEKPVLAPLAIAASPAAVGWTPRPEHPDQILGSADLRMISRLCIDID